MNLLYIGSTGDSWTTPWQGLMDHYDNPGLAATYNVLFFIVIGLVMLNLFIGVILEVITKTFFFSVIFGASPPGTIWIFSSIVQRKDSEIEY